MATLALRVGTPAPEGEGGEGVLRATLSFKRLLKSSDLGAEVVGLSGVDAAALDADARNEDARVLESLGKGLQVHSLLLFRNTGSMTPLQLRQLYTNIHKASGWQSKLPEKRNPPGQDPANLRVCVASASPVRRQLQQCARSSTLPMHYTQVLKAVAARVQPCAYALFLSLHGLRLLLCGRGLGWHGGCAVADGSRSAGKLNQLLAADLLCAGAVLWYCPLMLPCIMMTRAWNSRVGALMDSRKQTCLGVSKVCLTIGCHCMLHDCLWQVCVHPVPACASWNRI